MSHVLFVDDEQMLLDGLRNVLRPMRKQWDMSFATSGDDALVELARKPIDVIVTDMRMPVMDGVALLRRVQKEFPRVVRIILSGQTDQESVMRSLPLTHQFLSKPCDTTRLKAVVGRALELRKLVENESLRATIGSLGALPSAPQLYLALQREVADPDSSARRLAGIIEQDVAISAKVLQLVNSAFFGLSNRITSIQSAVAYLGVGTVRNLVLSVEVFRKVSDVDPRLAVALEQMRMHSLLAARIASRLFTEPTLSEDAYAAALLHDVGKLVPFRSMKALGIEGEEVDEPPGHARVGAYLIGLWGLPFEVMEAVAYHHTPRLVAHDRFDLIDAVHVADSLAHLISHTDPARAMDIEHLAKVGVTEDELLAWRALSERAAAEGSSWKDN